MCVQLKDIQLDCQDKTLVVTPFGDMTEFRLADFEFEFETAMKQFESNTDIHNVVIDLKETDYFGSSTVSLILRIWRQVRDRGGVLALCNVSQHEKEILKLTHLEALWTIYDSLVEAMAALEKS